MIRRFSVLFLSVLFLLLTALSGLLFVALRGPSESVRNQLTLSLLETSAAKFVPGLFLSDALVEEIVAGNAVLESEEITDTSMVTTNWPQASTIDGENGGADASAGGYGDGIQDEWADYPEGIRIETIKAAAYRGYVMLVRDPSRVYAATSSNFKNGQPGLKIHDALAKEGAVAAINGGGFPDVNGVGLGNLPIGLVISKGTMLWGNEGTTYSSVIGFNTDNVLIVGSMTPAKARELQIRDAMCFGPTLVVNGEPAEVTGMDGGLNPRSAIGQRADGAVILLCVDGRMPSSLGASFSDLIEIMLSYGAVNASNLDGGSSSHLYYNGEAVNISSSLYGPRRLPTFFMVGPLADGDGMGIEVGDGVS